MILTRSSRKPGPVLLRELMFTDDGALVAHMYQYLPDIVTHLAPTAKTYGVQIYMNNT